MTEDDRPQGLDDLLNHLAEVIPPPTPEEALTHERWKTKMDARRRELETRRSMIEVHSFESCPPEWQALSNNGGDEDWLVTTADPNLIYSAEMIAESLDTCGQPQEVQLPNGRRAWITSHA